MLKRQIPEYRKAIYQLLDVKGEKFAYAVVKNKDLIERVWKEYIEIGKKYNPSDDFLKYDKERVELAEKFSKKDEKGEPVVANERYDIEDKNGFEKALEELRVKHSDAIEEREKQIAEYEKELDEEIEVNFHKVKSVPESISGRELEAAMMVMYEKR